MKTTLEQFKRLLPTLQHVARFPSCNRAAICRRDGVGIAELDAVIIEVCGSPALWDEEYLAKAAKALGVTVPAFKPGTVARSASVTDAPARPVSVMPPGRDNIPRAMHEQRVADREGRASVAAPPAKPAVATPSAPAARAVVADGRRRREIKPKYLAVLRALIDDPRLTENQAVQRCGVLGGSWSYFKSTRLGGGPIDLAKAQALIDGAAEPGAKRELATSPAPVKREPVAVDVIKPAVADGSGILEKINALLAGWRVEVTAFRIVPGATNGGGK